MSLFKVILPLSIGAVSAFGLVFTPMCVLADTVVQKQTMAQYAAAPKQNLAQLSQAVTEYLLTQTVGYPGRVNIAARSLDPNLKLSACADVNVFMPNGSRPWGKTSVGVRCTVPSAWTVYVQATVKVEAQYLVAAAPLVQGQVVQMSDMLMETGDLTQLPAGVFTDSAQAVGRTVNISMNAGTVLRQDMLKQSPVVQQGQTVTLTTNGQGFSISAEGKAMHKAAEGQVVQVKVSNGQLVSGIAHSGAKVEVTY